MQVTVSRINIPAMSTIGYGEGTGPDGESVTFVGDHRPMRNIGEAIAAAKSRDDLPVVDLEDWQISAIPPEHECGSCGALIDPEVAEQGDLFHGPDEDCRAARPFEPTPEKETL